MVVALRNGLHLADLEIQTYSILRKKVTFHKGNLKQFKEAIAKHKSHQTNYKVVSAGLSRMIIHESGIRERYFSNSKSNRIEGAYFVNLVKKQVDLHIGSDKPTPKFTKDINAQCFNVDAINEALLTDPNVECIDLNSCYWRTAYNLGFINKRLYDKGIKSGHKKGLVVSIGALNKLPYNQTYVAGECVFDAYDYKLNDTYSPYYWAIISKVRDVMMDVYLELGDDLYMWLTDCAFVKSDKKEVVEAIFQKHSYESKSYQSKLSKIADDKVLWMDLSKDKIKSISISKRLIQEEYKRWKIIADFNDTDFDNAIDNCIEQMKEDN